MREECIQVRTVAPMGLMRAISGERFRNNESEGNTKNIADDAMVGVKCIIGGPASISRYAVWAFLQCCRPGANADFQCYYAPGEQEVITTLSEASIQDIDQFMAKYPALVKSGLTKKQA